MSSADEAVLGKIEADLLNPAVIERTIKKVVAHYDNPPKDSSRQNELQKALARTTAERDRFVAAIAAVGGDVPSLVTALKQSEKRLQQLQQELDSMQTVTVPLTVNPKVVATAIRERLSDLKRLLRENTEAARKVLATLLEGRFTFTPRKDGMREFYEFTAPGTLRPILQGIVEIPVTRIGVPNGNWSFLAPQDYVVEVAAA